MRRAINTIPKDEYEALLKKAMQRMSKKFRSLSDGETSKMIEAENREDYKNAEMHDFNSRALMHMGDMYYKFYNPPCSIITEQGFMPNKWAKAREYANFMHKKVEEFHGRKCSPADIFYKKLDIEAAYVTGWEEAIEIVKKMPAEELEKFLKGE